MKVETDILIVGGGLAAIKAAYECMKSSLNITIAVKSKLCSGSSFSPYTSSLGCQCPLDNDADTDYFLDEINSAGYGMNDEALSKILISEIWYRARELEQIGIDYKVLEVKRPACFSKRPRYLLDWGDWGRIRNNMYGILEENTNVKLVEDTEVIYLVKESGRIRGAIAVDGNGKLMYIQAGAVILATGGLGDIYKHSFNSCEASGDGYILALDAGAKLVNMEFIQFIPGFTKPVYKTIFGEHTLVYCSHVTDQYGNDILEKYLPHGTSSRQCIDERSKHGPFTTDDISRYFDLALMKEILKSDSENGFRLQYDKKILEDKSDMMDIYVRWLKDEKKIDITKDEICIIPFAHAGNGGVLIDESCSTGIDGLFVAGENAGGIHGANRLGGNSTGSCLVFGKRAADSAVRQINSSCCCHANSIDLFDLISKKFDSGVKKSISPEYVISEIQNIMWRSANVIRNETSLKSAIDRVSNLNKSYNAFLFFSDPVHIKQAVKAKHFIELSTLLLNAMIIRKESRGPHYREDFPEINEAEFRKRINIQKLSDGGILYDFE